MKTELLTKIRQRYRIIYDKNQDVYWLKKGKKVLTAKYTKPQIIEVIQKDVRKTYICNNIFLTNFYEFIKTKNSGRDTKL